MASCFKMFHLDRSFGILFSWKMSFAGVASSTGFGSNPQDRKQGESKTSLCTVTAAAKGCTKEKVQLSCS